MLRIWSREDVPSHIALEEELLRTRYLLKLLVIGNATTGKSSTVSRFVNDSFSDQGTHVSTIGADYSKKTVAVGASGKSQATLQ